MDEPAPKRPLTPTTTPPRMKLAPLLVDHVAAETGTVLTVSDWTQLSFAPLSIPTSSPIVDCVPALEDSVWAQITIAKEN